MTDGLPTLVADLALAGVRVRLGDDALLHAAPSAALTDSIRDALRSQKSRLTQIACHVCGDIRLVAYDAGGRPNCSAHALERACRCGKRNAYFGDRDCVSCIAGSIVCSAQEQSARRDQPRSPLCSLPSSTGGGTGDLPIDRRDQDGEIAGPTGKQESGGSPQLATRAS